MQKLLTAALFSQILLLTVFEANLNPTDYRLYL